MGTEVNGRCHVVPLACCVILDSELHVDFAVVVPVFPFWKLNICVNSSLDVITATLNYESILASAIFMSDGMIFVTTVESNLNKLVLWLLFIASDPRFELVELTVECEAHSMIGCHCVSNCPC